MYEILPYTYRRAKSLKVTVQPSMKEGKKIDVYKNGVLICSVGDIRYLDFPMYRKLFGKQIAADKKRLYKLRHASDRNVPGSAGWYADKLLW